MFEINFGLDISQADGANEIPYLVSRLVSDLGFTSTLICTIGAVLNNQSARATSGNYATVAVPANYSLRFAIEVAGATTYATDSTANHGNVVSASVTEPTVNYILDNGTASSAVFHTALQALIAQYTAFPYTDDSGAAQTANLSSTTVTQFIF